MRKQMSANPVYALCIQRAAERLGGFDELSLQVGISARLLQFWANGGGWPPDHVFLRIVDLVLTDDLLHADIGALGTDSAKKPTG
jgi:hypothetical protein